MRGLFILVVVFASLLPSIKAENQHSLLRTVDEERGALTPLKNLKLGIKARLNFNRDDRKQFQKWLEDGKEPIEVRSIIGVDELAQQLATMYTGATLYTMLTTHPKFIQSQQYEKYYGMMLGLS